MAFYNAMPIVLWLAEKSCDALKKGYIIMKDKLKELLYDIQREKDPDKVTELIRNWLLPPFDIHCIKVPPKHAGEFSLLTIYKCRPNIGKEMVFPVIGRNDSSEYGHTVIIDDGNAVGINIWSQWFNEHFEKL